MIGFQDAHCDTPVELSSKIDEEIEKCYVWNGTLG